MSDSSPLKSGLCTEASLCSEPLLAWADRIRPAWDFNQTGQPTLLHRKFWEWLYILQALEERGMLGPGRRGLGFGIGQDPLVSIMAGAGCSLVGTDLDAATAAKGGWVETGQHATTATDLNQAGFCDPEAFDRLFKFQVVDMNDIPSDLRGFDFTWSACAFEHLGSLALGKHFLLEQMKCLRPGGVAVHTTEFNVSSNDDTVEMGQTVLFRRRDIEELVQMLRADGHGIDVDFESGDTPSDHHIDVPPYSSTHLKIAVEGYVTTSLALIIEKHSGTGASHPSARVSLLHREMGRRRLELAARLDRETIVRDAGGSQRYALSPLLWLRDRHRAHR